MNVYRIWTDKESFENGWEVHTGSAQDAIRQWIEEADKPDDYVDEDMYEDAECTIHVALVDEHYDDDSDAEPTHTLRDGSEETWTLRVQMVPKVTLVCEATKESHWLNEYSHHFQAD